MVSRRRLLELGLASAAGLAGCSDLSGNDTEGAESATSTDTATPTETATDTPTPEPAVVHSLPFTDEAASTDTLHDQSDTGSLSVSESRPRSFKRPSSADEGSDSARFVRSSTEETELVYAFSKPVGWLNAEVHNVNNEAGSVSVYTSSDGEDWNKIYVSTDKYSVVALDGGWNSMEISYGDFDSDIRYVKLVVSGSDVAWNPQIGHVEVKAERPGDNSASDGPISMSLKSDPVNPDLSEAGRNVLGYLQNLPGNGWLSGQHEYDPGGKGRLEYVQSVTGEHPGLVGYDVGFGGLDNRVDAITNTWNDSNQLTTISWHVSAPPIESTEFENSSKESDIDAVLTEGTEENTVYMEKLAEIADFLETLDDEGVPIIWRPFHEADAGYFWWGKEGASQFNRLWEHMFDYLHDERGLTNLIWVWSGSHEKPESEWYPGDEYVDIAGVDTYKSQKSLSWEEQWDNMNDYVTNRPVALTESDSIPHPQKVRSGTLPFLWFLTWHGEHIKGIDKGYLKFVYNHPFTINRGDLPEF